MRKKIFTLFAVLLGTLIVTGIGKYIRAEPIENNLEAVEMPRRWWDALATLEMALALGMIVGLFWPPLLFLTALALVGYFGGAVLAHIRAKDPNVVPAGIMTALSLWLASLVKGKKSLSSSDLD